MFTLETAEIVVSTMAFLFPLACTTLHTAPPPHYFIPSEDNRENLFSLMCLILIVLSRRLQPHDRNHHEKAQTSAR